MTPESKKVLEILGLIYLGVGIYATFAGLKSIRESRERQTKMMAELQAIKVLLAGNPQLVASAPKALEGLDEDFIAYLIS